jgi:precorrin-6A/cobalt-precorrin-6A reductase
MPASARDKVLILGGTGEARALAQRLADMTEISVITSLAGRTRDPTLPAGEVRIGGFGGAAGLNAYLKENAIRLLINATHPFAATMSANALAAHQESGVPLLRLLRPAWRKQPDDTWIKAPSIQGAAAICRWLGKRVLLSVGSQEVGAFANLPRAHFFVRMVDPPEAPLPLVSGETIVAKGPFALTDERRLLLEQEIDLIVTKNSGGDATFAKLAAARELSIPVVMIERPEIALHPGCETVETVAAAFDWVSAQFRAQILRRVRTGDSSATTGDSA